MNNPETQKQGIPVLQKGEITRRNFLKAGGAILGLTAIGGVAAKFGLPLLRKEMAGPPIPDTYDPNLEIQTVQAGINALPITSREQLTSLLNGGMQIEGDQIHPQNTILFPVELTNGSKTNLEIRGNIKLFNNYTQENEYGEMGQNFTVPNSGTKIILPITKGEVFQVGSRKQGDQSYYGGLKIRFSDTNNNPCELWFAGEGLYDMSNILPIGKTTTAPIIGTDGYAGRFVSINEKGILLNGGTEILETKSKNVKIHMDLVTMNPLLGLIKIRFATSEDGKLLYKSPTQP